jgi:hypothetical protein
MQRQRVEKVHAHVKAPGRSTTGLMSTTEDRRSNGGSSVCSKPRIITWWAVPTSLNTTLVVKDTAAVNRNERFASVLALLLYRLLVSQVLR